ncbi:hypothetical protein I4F81_006145 [Pyropia yezoensis]|uniref:Uncharacterized protein n=1 Tax=Pyropia yezoensis TaxID=2788 RepID=A0ACC3C0W9_PYRYE|nr:hypothetical protein I4F81_006145 [Neopyropia yezoensis]
MSDSSSLRLPSSIRHVSSCSCIRRVRRAVTSRSSCAARSRLRRSVRDDWEPPAPAPLPPPPPLAPPRPVPGRPRAITLPVGGSGIPPPLLVLPPPVDERPDDGGLLTVPSLPNRQAGPAADAATAAASAEAPTLPVLRGAARASCALSPPSDAPPWRAAMEACRSRRQLRDSSLSLSSSSSSSAASSGSPSRSAGSVHPLGHVRRVPATGGSVPSGERATSTPRPLVNNARSIDSGSDAHRAASCEPSGRDASGAKGIDVGGGGGGGGGSGGRREGGTGRTSPPRGGASCAGAA